MAARVVEVSTRDELLAALGPRVPQGRAAVLIGGADRLEPEAFPMLRPFFDALADHLQTTATSLVDGGTDTGVMRLIGEARARRDGSFRLVGILPRGALRRSAPSGVVVRIARDHPEILLVPGSEFGDETEWLFGAADHLAGGAAPAIVVSGGELTFTEAARRLADGHIVVAAAGSGRAADRLAGGRALRRSGRLRVVPLDVDRAGLADALGGR